MIYMQREIMSEKGIEEYETERRISLEASKRENALRMEIERLSSAKSYSPAGVSVNGVGATIGSLESRGYAKTNITKVSAGSVRPLAETHISSLMSDRERQVDRLRIMARR